MGYLHQGTGKMKHDTGAGRVFFKSNLIKIRLAKKITNTGT